MATAGNIRTGSVLVSATELANDFRVSDVEIAKLARRGIIPRQPHPLTSGRVCIPTVNVTGRMWGT